MAGKKKTSPGPVKAPSTLLPEVAAQVADLKSEAEKSFLSKGYAKAIDAYDQAIKLLPADAPEKAELLQKSAGCYLMDKKYKEAIKACNAVLEQQPNSTVSLKTRAKAYEHMGFFKQALADAQAINKGEGASEETRQMEKRLKEATSANKAKLQANGSGAQTVSPRSASAAQKPSFPYMITVKATLEDETRLLQASLMVSYAELYAAVKAKFPNAGPFVLKYTDKEGDSVTITSRNDFQLYLGDLITQYQKQMQGNAARPNTLPAMRIQVVKVSSEAEVPKPPADELPAQEQPKAQKEEPQQQEYELDEWLIEFARMFSEITGIDPVAHHEQLNMGHDKIAKAVDASLSDAKALPLFDKAAEHFRDATCSSIIQWGNVHIIKADRQAQSLLRAGKPLDSKAVDAMLKEYDECEKKFNEALKVKSDSWEANGSMGQLEWERAKAKMGYVIPTPAVEDATKDGEQEAKDAAAAALKEALAKLDPKKVSQVQKHIDNVTKWFDKALGFAKAAEEHKKAEEEASEEGKEEAAKKPELTAEQKAQQQLQSPSGNMLVMHGNILYEWSQVMAAVKKEWKPMLDSAVAKFRAAGAAEADIRGALKNHSQKDELDLGPDPEPEAEPEKPAEEAKEAPKEEVPQAKGLPSLEVKKKPKA